MSKNTQASSSASDENVPAEASDAPVKSSKKREDYYSKLEKGRKLLEQIKRGETPKGWRIVEFDNGNKVKVPQYIADIYKEKHFVTEVK